MVLRNDLLDQMLVSSRKTMTLMFLPIGTYLLLLTTYVSCFGYPQCFWGYLVVHDHWPMHFCKALSWKSLWIKASAKWINVNYEVRLWFSISYKMSKTVCVCVSWERRRRTTVAWVCGGEIRVCVTLNSVNHGAETQRRVDMWSLPTAVTEKSLHLKHSNPSTTTFCLCLCVRASRLHTISCSERVECVFESSLQYVSALSWVCVCVCVVSYITQLQ